ncbi:MAG: hypothetical protein K0R26_1079 [Bacteroidota bacterium]|jgi:hypothetical protein|nr:hypothetical protein [Bacteroidota bacterium]
MVESKPYTVNDNKHLDLSGWITMEGKANGFTGIKRVDLSFNNVEVSGIEFGQFEIIYKLDQTEKHSYFNDTLIELPIILNKISTQHSVPVDEMYLRCTSPVFLIASQKGASTLLLSAKVTFASGTLTRSISVPIEEREFHPNDFPGVK